MERFPHEELIPSAVEGRGGNPLRFDEDEDDGRIVSVMRPPGDFPRSVAWKPEGGSTGGLKHMGMLFSSVDTCLILVPSAESLHSVEEVICFAGSRHGYRGSGEV